MELTFHFTKNIYTGKPVAICIKTTTAVAYAGCYKSYLIRKSLYLAKLFLQTLRFLFVFLIQSKIYVTDIKHVVYFPTIDINKKKSLRLLGKVTQGYKYRYI